MARIVAGMADGELQPVYTWRQAQDVGMTRAQLQADGVRATRGAYVSRAVDATLLTTCRAAALALPPEAAFASSTAAALWGAPTRGDRPIRLVVPPGVDRPRRDGFRASMSALGPDDVIRHQGLPLTTPERTWCDLAAEGSPVELLVVGDALLRAGLLDRSSLDRLLAERAGARGVAVARRVVPLLDGGAASRPESVIRWYVLDSDLPAPQVQVPVRDVHGRVRAHGDLGYEKWRLLMEYEGRQHAEREQFRRDIERYSRQAADGWLTLRFADQHLGRRDVVVSRVRAALLSRGWRP